MHVRRPNDIIGKARDADGTSSASSAPSSVNASPATARAPSLPPLSPRGSPLSVRAPGGARDGACSPDRFPEGFRPRFVQPRDFVVGDYLAGLRKRSMQDERTEAATQSTYMALGPAPEPFFRTRTSFQPAAAPRWEQPLPVIDREGSPLRCRPGAAPPPRNCLL